jgi:outer membrane receptor for ferrienterochelin and colicin
MTLSIFKNSATLTLMLVMIGSVAFSQTITDLKILLPQKECTIKAALSAARDQTGVDFSYGSNFPADRMIRFGKNEVSMSSLLKQIKAETGFGYKIQGKKILLIPAKKFTVSGFLRDSQTGENLIGANVCLAQYSGTTTNQFGYYSLTLESDTVKLSVSYVGYEAQHLRFFLSRDTVVDVAMSPKILDEVVITDEENILEETQMSAAEMPVRQIEALPAMAGEVDVLKSLQLLPGVQAGAEGSGGLYVRGGSPDQNLILLDGVPVYNVSHLFGFISVFNSDAINHVELIKGGFPARYGGRLSSVVNISMKEGNQKKLSGEGAIGLVSSKLTLEGPIKKNKSSFIVSARRTFADLAFGPLIRAKSNGMQEKRYYFYDLNAKVNAQINHSNRLYFSLYAGNDKASSFDKSKFINDTLNYNSQYNYSMLWGNVTSALRVNTVITPKVFSNITATYSQYRFNTIRETSESVITPNQETDFHFKNELVSGIRDITLKGDVDFIPRTNHYIRSGVYGIGHLFSPGAMTYRVGETYTPPESQNIQAIEYGAYVEDDVRVSERVRFNLGAHFSGFYVEKRNYTSLQPRIALRYLISEKIAFKASYARMQQYIHLLTNVGIGLPTDLWVPATRVAKPEQSWQGAIGVAYRPKKNYEFSLESYYKEMLGLIEYKNGASFTDMHKDWQTKIEIGRGESYGCEVFMKKTEGKWSGWIGYTLAWANRYFYAIDEGRKFPFKYDRRHDLETAVMYTWNKRVDFAFTWSYGSGYPASMPSAAYLENYGGSIIDESARISNALDYPSRNNYRMRDFHRLDVTISFLKQKRWGERKWILGLYNAYNRKNPFYLRIEQVPNEKRTGRILQHSLFPLIPSISYNFKF